MTILTRRYGFSASHRLASNQLDAGTNRKIFGKCANPHGHGHNYVLEVSVAGNPDPASGMTLHRARFDHWVGSAVLDRIDHSHLNSDIDEFSELVPTSENMLVVIDAWLRRAWPAHFPDQSLMLAGLRLEETPRNSFRVEAVQPLPQP